MPASQRDFLAEVSKLRSLREYIEAHSSNEEWHAAYDDCIKKLRAWRGKHIALVSKYIVQPAREAQRAAVVEKIEEKPTNGADEEWELQGTGGSALIPMLRQSRDETIGLA
jgi:indoleamine 2,3-dioxygenase